MKKDIDDNYIQSQNVKILHCMIF